MTLDTANKGMIYRVEIVDIDIAIKRRLEALGLTNGTKVKVLNRNSSGSVIFMVRGSRLAIGKHIAESIKIQGE
ncbi:MAG TPA: ferrous iron transport protein A [Clostridiales bacterium]|nr:ferrous iron transport protein A [Clostridiales bacterium]